MADQALPSGPRCCEYRTEYALDSGGFCISSCVHDVHLGKPPVTIQEYLPNKGSDACREGCGQADHDEAQPSRVDWVMPVDECGYRQGVAAPAAYLQLKQGNSRFSLRPSPGRRRLLFTVLVLVVAGVMAGCKEAKAQFHGSDFRDCEECPEMVVLSAGSFLMGSPPDEEDREADEGPQHRVEIAQPFAVGKYEVTRGEFSRFVSATGHATGNSCRIYESGRWRERSGRNWRSPGFSQSEQDPVVCVSWEDAQAYVGWLSRKTAKSYRLLTESEWEYAARAGTTTPFHFGGTISTDQANYNGNYTYGRGRKGVWRKETVEVGMFPANAFGLHDMHGNVWEWVEDCWHDSYAGAPADGSAWTKGGECGRRLLRGGSWYGRPRNLRAAYRLRYTATNRYLYDGLRVVRTLTP